MTIIRTGHFVSVEALVTARHVKNSILTKADVRKSINEQIKEGRIVIGKPPASKVVTDKLIIVDNGTHYAWRIAC